MIHCYTALEKYSDRPLTVKSSSPKILPLAPALIHSSTDPSEIDRNPEWKGRVFEAVIGAELAKHRGKLFYWRQGNHEDDFILKTTSHTYAIEVKSGRKRNAHGLQNFCALYKYAIPIVVDLDFGSTRRSKSIWLATR